VLTAYERLSAQDASFLQIEGPTTPMHVGAVALFTRETSPGNAPFGLEELRAHVAARLSDLPRYRSRLAFTPLAGHPIWVDDPRFDVASHVHHVSVPAPGDEAKLKELVGELFAKPLDRARPLWEMWLVEGLRDDRFALVAKVHHSLADGASCVALMEALFDAKPTRTIPQRAARRARPQPSRTQLAADELTYRLKRYGELARTARNVLRDPEPARRRMMRTGGAVWQALGDGIRRIAPTPLNGAVGARRRLEWRSFDLQAMKDARKAVDGTVNDVVLATVAGALRRFLRARRFALRGVDFRVLIPVDVRSGCSDPAAGNQVSGLFLSLPVSEPNPRRRFERIRNETARLKSSHASEGLDWILRLADRTGSELPTYGWTRLAKRLAPFHMVVTNVRGPQFPLYLLDARLDAIHPQVPLLPCQGLGVAVMSYCGRVHFGLMADRDLVPDVSRLAECFDAAFEELRSL
jgi:WS/DGAT/MGAT family acyltransferase